jgi:pimeloyl-[acyl-carrier protein] methyl ester esterase
VQALAEQMPKPLGVAGWSLGATVALKWALLRPAQVRALALVAATPSFAAREDWPWGWSRETLESFERDLERDPAVALKRFLSLQVKGENEGRDNLRTLRQFISKTEPPSPAALAWGLGILKETDLRNALAGVRQPAMLIHGDCDSVVPVAAGSFLAEHLPNARLRIFSGCGHVPFLFRRERFAAELIEFFNGPPIPG